MICRTESLAGLPSEPQDPFTLRIVSSAQAYGLQTTFLDVWQGNGCLFSRMDGVLTISGTPTPDCVEETALFAASCGTGQIFCAVETAKALEFSMADTGPMLCREQTGPFSPLPLEMPSPKMLYRILSACESPSFPVPDFEPFYLDISHRLRHGTAAAVLLEVDGGPCACAIALAVTDNAALLTAVGVVPSYRRKGMGKKAVESLCQMLGGRRIFLFRHKNENQKFYEKLGFSSFGEWAEI